MKALIIGAGIAGPVAAIALREVGIDATVYEAYGVLAHDVGGHIALAPNGIDALAAIDLAAPVAEIATPSHRIVMRSSSGRRSLFFPYGKNHPTPASGEGPGLVLSRAELYRVVYDEAVRRGIRIVHGGRLDFADPRPSSVLAGFVDGSYVTGDLLIGADGTWSTVRGVVAPDAGRPVYSGLVALAGRADGLSLDASAGDVHLMFGRRAFFGYVVRETGEVCWFADLPRLQEPSREDLALIPSASWRHRLGEVFASDNSPAGRIVRATRIALQVDVVHTLDPPRRWYQDRMVLIGDAAHVVSPSTGSSAGQGASLAIEDAVQLARCLRDRRDISDAFEAFQRLRDRRVRRILDHARQVDRAKLAGPFARRFRGATLPMLARSIGAPESNLWIFGHHIEFDRSIDYDLRGRSTVA